MDDWEGIADAYRRSFATLCAGTVAGLLDRLPEGRLLDVGCGTGDLLAEAERRNYRVVGVDADPEMVAMSSRVADGPVCRAALPTLPFADATFAAVTANFVVNHVGDPRAAVRELGRVLAVDGRLAITIWPTGGAGWQALVDNVFATCSAVPVVSSRLPDDRDFPRNVDGLTSLVGGADLQVHESDELHWTWQVDPTDLWAGIAGGVAAPGRTYRAQTPEVRARIEREFFAEASDSLDNGHLVFPARAILAVAGRPSG